MHLFISLRERRPSETFLSSLEQLQKRAFTRVTLSGLPPAQAKLSPSAGVLPAQGRCSWHSPLVPPQLCTSLLDLGHPNSIKHAELSPVRVYYDSGNKQPRTWRFKATQTCYLTVVEARSAKRILMSAAWRSFWRPQGRVHFLPLCNFYGLPVSLGPWSFPPSCKG